jgi:RES domain-containing protein
MRVFRLFPGRFLNTAFSGIGGLYAARRWNHRGTELVYTASSRALAALEFFVHLDPRDAPDDLLMAEAEVPDGLTEQLNMNLLPDDWRELNSMVCRDLGSTWVKERRSAALRVPSAVVDGDWNVLLNSRHADFTKLELFTPRPFRYDERMFR